MISALDEVVQMIGCLAYKTCRTAAPMRNRISAWVVYDVFDVRGDEQIFLAVATEN